MKIHGLQKMTLLDFPGKVACTIFIGGCNFRCPFCHNAELTDANAPAEMDDEAFLSFLKKRTGLLDGVAITGGEPLMNPELPELIRKIKALGFPVKLDTDGAFPDRLEALLAEGLVDYVAMDIKNSRTRYAQACGVPQVNLELIERSISLLMRSGIDYEFRTTCVEQLHDEDSIRDAAEMITGAKKYFLQAFTDRDTVVFKGLSAPSSEKMHEFARIAAPYVQQVELRGIE